MFHCFHFVLFIRLWILVNYCKKIISQKLWARSWTTSNPPVFAIHLKCCLSALQLTVSMLARRIALTSAVNHFGPRVMLVSILSLPDVWWSSDQPPKYKELRLVTICIVSLSFGWTPYRKVVFVVRWHPFLILFCDFRPYSSSYLN